jgi:hypothetical protein
MISISIEVEPHQITQIQIFPVHHGQQSRIEHTHFAGNAENYVTSQGLAIQVRSTCSLQPHPAQPCLPAAVCISLQHCLCIRDIKICFIMHVWRVVLYTMRRRRGWAMSAMKPWKQQELHAISIAYTSLCLVYTMYIPCI